VTPELCVERLEKVKQKLNFYSLLI